MIKVRVFLKNSYSREYKEIDIARDEVYQLACDKARDLYAEGYWEIIIPDGDIRVEVNA